MTARADWEVEGASKAGEVPGEDLRALSVEVACRGPRCWRRDSQIDATLSEVVAKLTDKFRRCSAGEGPSVETETAAIRWDW
jgi:hypothetical protein